MGVRIDSLADLPEWARKQAFEKMQAQQVSPAAAALAAAMTGVEGQDGGMAIRDMANALSALEGEQGAGKGEKKRKYRNQPTERIMPNGKPHVFSSRAEARRYDELSLLLTAGEIMDLRMQEQYYLQGAYIDANGERVGAVRYDADFTYRRVENGVPGEKVVEDVKRPATRTDKYKIKEKLMRERFGIEIQEVDA